jgi:hypothetical protein
MTGGKQGPKTKTISVRLPLEEAVEIEKQAKGRGFKNLNQYLIATLRLLGPISKPVEQLQHEPLADTPSPTPGN